MKKLLLLFALLLTLSCSCRTTGTQVIEQDQHAVMVQGLMESSVGIDITDKVQIGKEQNTREYLGSGVVVGYDPQKDITMLLTAGHVCDSSTDVIFEDEKEKGHVLAAAGEVTNFFGKSFPMIMSMRSKKYDLCTVFVKGFVGPVVYLADQQPPIGAVVQNVSCPAGYIFPMSMYFTEGAYDGSYYQQDNRHFMSMSLLIKGGSSGSGVFYRGKLVGILVGINAEFNGISVAVPLAEVRDFLGVGNKNG